MYICTQCNQIVPDPVNNKCPRGHLLYDRHLLGSTRELSFGAAFLITLIVCVVLFLATAGTAALLKKSTGTWSGYILVIFIVAGIIVLFRGLKWKSQGGAVARLAPRATGMAVACLLAGGGLFALGIALNLIR